MGLYIYRSDVCLCGHLWSSHGGGNFETYTALPKKRCMKLYCKCEDWEQPQKRII